MLIERKSVSLHKDTERVYFDTGSCYIPKMVHFTLSNTGLTLNIHLHIDGLVQGRRNSSALAMELRLSCTNPSIWYVNNGVKCWQSVSPTVSTKAFILHLNDALTLNILVSVIIVKYFDTKLQLE